MTNFWQNDPVVTPAGDGNWWKNAPLVNRAIGNGTGGAQKDQGRVDQDAWWKNAPAVSSIGDDRWKSDPVAKPAGGESGPWEKYAPADDDGPWKKYQAQAGSGPAEDGPWKDYQGKKLRLTMGDQTAGGQKKTFEFTSPEGKTYEVEGPAGATTQQAFEILKNYIDADKPKAGPGFATGVARSVASGVPILGGLLNKVDAATNAALAPVLNPIFPENDQLKGDFGQRYGQALKTQEGMDEGFAEQHPYVDAAGNLAGGIAGLGAAAGTKLGAEALGLTAKTLPGMIARGAVSGAGVGALDQAARGGDASEGAIYGGAAGLAGPVVGKLAGEVAAPVARVLRGLHDPEAEAGRRVAGALQRDVNAGNAGLTQGEMQGAQARGQPTALMDLGGETTRALARSAANTSPEARGVIERFTSDRFAGQGGRVSEWLNTTFNYPDAEATQKALKETARTVNRPAYAKAYAKGGGGLWDADLEQMSQAPVVQDAIRRTMVSAKNEAAKTGFTPPKNPFVTDASGRLTLGQDASGKKLIPGLQFWDYVKRNLDGVGTREAKEWSRVLRDHLDGSIPEYADARAGAAKFFGAQDALEAGQKAVTSRMQNRQIRDALGKFSPAEKKLFQDGFVDRFVQAAREAPDRRNLLNSINNSPAARERVMMALGPQRANELEAFLRVEQGRSQ